MYALLLKCASIIWSYSSGIRTSRPEIYRRCEHGSKPNATQISEDECRAKKSFLHVMIFSMPKSYESPGHQKVTLVEIFSWLCTFPITLCWWRQTPPGWFWRAVWYSLLLYPSIRPECLSWAVHHRLDKIPDSRP